MKTLFCYLRSLLLIYLLVMADCQLQLVAGPTLNYQGRLTAGGTNFTGLGYFKFVLIDGNGTAAWANSGSNGTNEPPMAASVVVNNGLFSVELGDTGLGMAEISPLVFHGGPLSLRTWFSTNNVVFERLSPDVLVNPLDLAHLDTGNAVIVDDDGRADFSSLQDAVNYAVSNDVSCRTILLMPGFYDGGVTIPSSSESICIRGVGNASGVNIGNSHGPAILLDGRTDLTLEHVCVRGLPALANTNTGHTNQQVLLRHCRLERSAESPGPAVLLDADATAEGVTATAFDCEILNYNGPGGGGSVELGPGHVTFRAAHCSIYSDGGASVMKVGGQAECHLESCDVACWDEGGADVSLLLDNASGYMDFQNCRLDDGVTAINGSWGGRFVDCVVSRTVSLHGVTNSGLAFRECEFGYDSGTRRFEVVSGNADIRLKNCYIYSSDATACYFENAQGSIRIENSEIMANDARVMEVVAADSLLDGTWVGVSCLNCGIHNSMAGAQSAIVLSNAPGNDARDVGVSLSFEGGYAESDSHDAVSCEGAGCEVDIGQCMDVRGRRHGIYAPHGAQVTVEGSNVEAEQGDALSVSGPGSIMVRASDIWGGDADGVPGKGRGIYAALESGGGEPPYCIVMQSMVGSLSGAGMEAEGGSVLVCDSFIGSFTNTMVLLRGTNTTASIQNSTLYSLGKLFGMPNTYPAVTLDGAAATPTPRIVGCLLETSPEASSVIDVTGGAMTANPSSTVAGPKLSDS